jgi:hypothetical protein
MRLICDANKKENLIENLYDSGCDKELIDEFFSLLEQNKFEKIYELLRKHREALLETIHKNQKEIDILDYLIFNLKKES